MSTEATGLRVCVYGLWMARTWRRPVRSTVGDCKPEARDKSALDIDTDTDTHTEYFLEKDAAMARAQEVYDTTPETEPCFGSIAIHQQLVEWFVEEDRVAHWQYTSDEDEISDTGQYQQYLAVKGNRADNPVSK